MARTIGLIAGAVSGMAATYGVATEIHRYTRDITRELRLASDIAADRPRLVRPYTDPINLQTRSVKDTFVDLWDAEIVKLVDWVFALSKKD